jgi:hypothetical protein
MDKTQVKQTYEVFSKLQFVTLKGMQLLYIALITNQCNMATTFYILDIKFLTCGNVNLTYEENGIIFKHVFDYIKCSNRFLIIYLELNWLNMHIILIHLNFIFPSVCEYSSLIRY